MSVIALDSNNASDGRPEEKSPTGWYKYWQTEMDAAEKRLRKFTRQGNLVNDRYLDERRTRNDDDSSYATSKLNLFYTNVSTLQSMLYGSTPQIDVAREHHDPDDDVARVASVMFQRILQADIAASGEDFPTALKAALQDRLLPGLGVCRVRYTFDTTMETVMNPDTLKPTQVLKVTNENAPVDYVHWQDFRWGWCRTWAEMPWMAFRSFLTKEEAKARFGAKKAKSLEYKSQLPTGTENKDETYDTDQKNNVRKAEIWEIWSKRDKKVFWWSHGPDIILDATDDPLQLDGFWPTPRPLTANVTTSLYTPRADYVLAQDLYTEIDELQARIATITRAVKVVGVYDQSASLSVGRMLKEGSENDLIPVENWAMFAEKGGLQGQIDWFPVQEVVATLQTLIGIRDQTIELLYQVTGMSDILRGANTDQYTSDGTQQLKAKFGSIRVQALQDEFARFAGDLEALKAEVISKHFQKGSIAHQASAQFLPQADQDKIQPALELMKSPDVKWRIDIRPESIAMVDYAQLKSERTEFLTAMATYIQSAQAAVQAVPGSLPILLEMLKWGMAGFKGSNYLEGTMDQAIDMAKKAPQDQSKDGQRDAAQNQAELDKIQAKLQADLQVIAAKGQQEMQKLQADHQANMAEQAAKNAGDLQKIREDLRADLMVIAKKLGADLTVEQAQSTYAIAERETEHEHNMTEEQVSHRNALAQTRSQPKPDA
ncbi:MAG: hypothetical protein KAJ55_10685 [Anaerolineales bacterium]|nr:hypothetical protein [Anaerolineales bacterium]